MSVTVVVVGVHVIPSGDVNTVELFVPTTHLPPPHAMHLAVALWRAVHVTPSDDVQMDVEPAAAHIHPFHAIPDLADKGVPLSDHSPRAGLVS